MASELKHPFAKLETYAAWVNKANLLMQQAREAGMEVAVVPEYDYPEIDFYVPHPFRGKAMLAQILNQAINGQLSAQLPTDIGIYFAHKFLHPHNGKRLAGFRWAANREEDSLIMLHEQLTRKNPIDQISLAWGDNPNDIQDERADLAFYMHDLDWWSAYAGLENVDTLSSPNNCVEFQDKIEKSNVGNWLQLGHMWVRSPSPVFAEVTAHVAKIISAFSPVALTVCIPDFWEDTYDKNAGDILMPNTISSITAHQLVSISGEIKQRYKNFRTRV